MNYNEDELNDVGYADVSDDEGCVYGCVYKNDDGTITFEKYPEE